MKRGGAAHGGATARATVGVGFGTNVLVGGSSDTIVLQPVSIEGGTISISLVVSHPSA